MLHVLWFLFYPFYPERVNSYASNQNLLKLSKSPPWNTGCKRGGRGCSTPPPQGKSLGEWYTIHKGMLWCYTLYWFLKHQGTVYSICIQDQSITGKLFLRTLKITLILHQNYLHIYMCYVYIKHCLDIINYYMKTWSFGNCNYEWLFVASSIVDINDAMNCVLLKLR